MVKNVNDWEVLRQEAEFKLCKQPEAVRIIILEELGKARVAVFNLFSPKKGRIVAQARRAIARRLSNELKLSSKAIGKILGRDHSSVLNLLNTDRTKK